MAWSVDYIAEIQIVELSISGAVTGDDLIAAAAARIALGQEKSVEQYIINARHIDAPESATPAVLDIPNRLYAEKNLSRSSQIAVIAPKAKQSAWITDFYEDICVNRGWRVKTFVDRDLAIDWLRGMQN